MKKITLILVLLIVFLNGCQVSKLEAEEPKEEGLQAIGERLPAGGGLPVNYGSLSDIQVTACNTAHEAGTCDTRLKELGIVLKAECCEVLGKCC